MKKSKIETAETRRRIVWRVIFTEDPTTIIVVAVGHRGEIYED